MAEEALKTDDNSESKDIDSEKEIPEHVAQAKEHGWKDLDTYVAEGGDPDMWRASKAFNGWYADKQDSKHKLGKMQSQIEDMTATFAQSTKAQSTAHRKELDKALAQAREDNDIDKFEEVSKEIQETEKEVTPQGEPPAVLAFRAKTPELDFASEKFNPSYNASVESLANKGLTDIIKKHDRAPSELEYNTILKEAADNAKKDFPHLFNGRKLKDPPAQANAGKKAQKKGDPLAKLDEGGLKMYHHLNESNPKAAKVFLENMTNG